MSLADSEYVAALVLDCVRLQARGQREAAERVYWQLVGMIGEDETKRRLAATKGLPDYRGGR